MTLFAWLDAAPGWAFVGVVIMAYGGMGLLASALDEWERRR